MSTVTTLKFFKRKINRNILVIKATLTLEKMRRHLEPSKGFHLDKIDKILAARELLGIHFFLETGTYLGVTTNYIKNFFTKVYSIELSVDLANEAADHFKNNQKVKIIQGDSGLLIEDIIKNNNEKKLFWLDAHYSSGLTAKSVNFGDTPISKEVELILKHWVTNSVILIDDARHFVGTDNYPHLKDLENFVHSKNLNLKFFVDKDIIHIF